MTLFRLKLYIFYLPRNSLLGGKKREKLINHFYFDMQYRHDFISVGIALPFKCLEIDYLRVKKREKFTIFLCENTHIAECCNYFDAQRCIIGQSKVKFQSNISNSAELVPPSLWISFIAFLSYIVQQS